VTKNPRQMRKPQRPMSPPPSAEQRNSCFADGHGVQWKARCNVVGVKLVCTPGPPLNVSSSTPDDAFLRGSHTGYVATGCSVSNTSTSDTLVLTGPYAGGIRDAECSGGVWALSDAHADNGALRAYCLPKMMTESAFRQQAVDKGAKLLGEKMPGAASRVQNLMQKARDGVKGFVKNHSNELSQANNFLHSDEVKAITREVTKAIDSPP